MTHPTTFAIAMCFFGFASSDMGRELTRNIQRMDVQAYATLEPRNPKSRQYEKEPLNPPKHEPSLEHLDHPVSKSGLVTQLQSDERFWKTFRDFDADADTMRAWKEFQTGLAGRD